jgi:hypothetical protein
MKGLGVSEEKILLKDLIRSAGKQLRHEFEEIRQNNPHAGESGAEAELILRKFLKERLPRRFDIESGLVVGTDGTVSNQTDLIIFDAMNSPIYRAGPRVHIIQRDNVAAVIEVKSKLNKEQLKDAARKIASVKKITASPITDVDQPVTFSNMIMTNTLGCVFAFDAYTSLTSLADNLREINLEYDSRNWIDLVIVLDKGFIGYAIKMPFDEELPGWFGGACVDEFPLPPYYILLVHHGVGDLTLNHFFVRLISHLTFFRKRSSIDFSAILGPSPSQLTTIQGYQYNLSKNLVPAEESHYVGNFKSPHIRFNIYSKKGRQFLGQVCLLSWQDGAVITCSVSFNPKSIFGHYFRLMKLDGIILPAGRDKNMFFSSILPISNEDFIKYSHTIHDDLITIRDSDDDELPPMTL